jgi:hypothetical protein
MSPRRRVLLLVLTMALLVIVVELITVSMLYRTALDAERSRLEEAAKSQARLIEAVARFDKLHSGTFSSGAEEATLSQIADAHAKYRGFGETGEFTLSKRVGDEMVFLLSHRHFDLNNPRPVPIDSNLAEPMRRALAGHSGTVIGLDYRGQEVLAAYEPVAVLDMGIVAKIDLEEIRAPYIRAVYLSGLSALLIIAIGAAIFFRITSPIIRGLSRSVDELKTALSEVKLLQGILPICGYCKKIRDDQGYWSQVEVYIRDRSDADFSHGICPDCLKEHFPRVAAGAKEKR